jgi:hypothetical protein
LRESDLCFRCEPTIELWAVTRLCENYLNETTSSLVGPKGQGFDDKEANPCKDQGNGAIPDTTDAVRKAALIESLAKVNEALRQKDMVAAQKSASQVQALLTPKM